MAGDIGLSGCAIGIANQSFAKLPGLEFHVPRPNLQIGLPGVRHQIRRFRLKVWISGQAARPRLAGVNGYPPLFASCVDYHCKANILGLRENCALAHPTSSWQPPRNEVRPDLPNLY
jgi:hypothetical protein